MPGRRAAHRRPARHAARSRPALCRLSSRPRLLGLLHARGLRPASARLHLLCELPRASRSVPHGTLPVSPLPHALLPSASPPFHPPHELQICHHGQELVAGMGGGGGGRDGRRLCWPKFDGNGQNFTRLR
jgi:hypothetical protein